MSTTVNVVCYKSKVLSNNESPLMLRVTKDRKRKYVSLGISVNPENWDFSKNQPKSDCPNREFIELMIAEKLKAYTSTNTISMFDFHNLLTEANKSSYIDSYLQRAVNATEVAVGINNALHGDSKYAWFLG